jgi:hypothetical protein
MKKLSILDLVMKWFHLIADLWWIQWAKQTPTGDIETGIPHLKIRHTVFDLPFSTQQR